MFGTRVFTYQGESYRNHNGLLYTMDGVDGLKTGFTKESGYGLVASAEQNGMRLIAVVMGAKGEKERADETRKLLEWGFNNFQSNPLFADVTLIESRGSSRYHSAQIKYVQRMEHGLSYIASYTYGKSTDDASGFFTSTS